MTDFQEVYNRYFRDVYRYALSLCRNETVAEEITQETFYKVLVNFEADGLKKFCKGEKSLNRGAESQMFNL